MSRKIAIDMDEVLADTLGEIIDAVNESKSWDFHRIFKW